MCYLPQQQQQQHSSSISALLAALKQSTQARDLPAGKLIHALAINTGRDSNIYVANSLVKMYAKCASLEKAQRIFERMAQRSTASWNTMLLAFADNGHFDRVSELLTLMQLEGCEVNSRTLVACLKAKSSSSCREFLERKGMEIHSRALELGLELDLFVGAALVEMYSRSGSMDRAFRVFENVKDHCDVGCWNALILGYVESGDGEFALKVFQWMLQGHRSSCVPNAQTFVAVLKACVRVSDQQEDNLESCRLWEKVMALHSEAVKLGLDSNVFLTNTLVDAYGKSGSLADAKKVFDEAPSGQTLVSWNALILSYADNGKGREALELFSSMPFEPSTRTFVAAVRACTTLAVQNSEENNRGFSATSKVLELGLAVHSRAMKLGLDLDVFVATSLIDLYSKLGSMADSQRAFDRANTRSRVSWNALILGYAENGEAEKSLELFAAMQRDGEASADAHTFVAVLKACSKVAAEEKARQVNGKAVKMVSLERCLAIHSQAAQLALGRYVKNTLVNCYAKCGSMVDAERVFWKRKEHNSLVSWTVMMLGYVENGESEKALLLFETIKGLEGLQRHRITSLLVAALKACSSLAELRATKWIQAQVFRCGTFDNHGVLDHDHDPATNTVVSSLIHAFGECSSMIDAQLVFDSFQPPELDVVSWNSLMAGFARQGNSKMVFQIFHALQDEQRFQPDGATFLSILTACSHAGLVLQCKSYFQAMEEFGVIPGIEHYHCVVDLLARANEMDQAVAVLEKMPVRANAVTWRSILAACLKWKNVKVGEFAFESLMEVSKGNDPAGYSLLTSLYRNCRGKS